MNTVPLSHVAEVQLGRQRSPQHETGEHLVPYLRSANISDGVLDLSDVKHMNFTPTEQHVFRLNPGDVLMTEGSGSAAAVGASAVWNGEVAGTVCFQNTLLRLRPRGNEVSGSFLYWWARHAHASGLIAAVAGGANIKHLGAEALRSLQVQVPQIADQVRIAAFLDDQVARIDETIRLRNRQLEIASDRLKTTLDALLVSRQTEKRLLMSITDPRRPVQYGIVLPGPDYPGGVPIVKGGDVAANRLEPQLLSRTDPKIEVGYSRSRLTQGDLLIAIRGSVGELAVVPEALSGANITQDAARIAPMGCSSEWLYWTLSTAYVQSLIAREVTGATVKGINIGSLRRIPIPWAERTTQDGLGREARRLGDQTRDLRAGIKRSITVLRERKRTLISAAVTGELEISTASGGLSVSAIVDPAMEETA